MSLSSIVSRLLEAGSAHLGGRSRRCTASEVRQLLDPHTEAPAEHRQVVLSAASMPSIWASHLDEDRAWSLGRLADRLPMIVCLYAAGTPLEEIRRRVGSISVFDVERALDTACACIARALAHV